MSSERRRSPRITPFVARCRLLVGSKSRTGYLTDLSVEGARVTSASPLAVGSALVLEVRLSPRHAQSRLPARVLWTQPAEEGAVALGLAFGDMGEADRRALHEVVEEYRRRAQELA
jgi:PilZ domain-containing protein